MKFRAVSETALTYTLSDSGLTLSLFVLCRFTVSLFRSPSAVLAKYFYAVSRVMKYHDYLYDPFDRTYTTNAR